MMTPPYEDEQVRQKIHALALQVAEKLGIYTSVIEERDVQFHLSATQDDPLVDAYDATVQAHMDAGTLFLRARYHITEQHWKVKLLRWTTPPAGIYSIKEFAPNDAASAWPRLSLYSTAGLQRGVSVGHGVLVGRTDEAFPRPVYRLYDRAKGVGEDGRRRIEGNFDLEIRRLNLIAADVQIRLCGR